LTIVDLVVLALLLAAIGHGLQAGAAVQIGSFAGFWGGLAVGAALAPRVSRLAADTPTRVVLALITLFGSVTVLSAFGRFLSARAISSIGHPRITSIDTALGAVVGGGGMLIGTWLVAGMLATVPLPGLTSVIQRSVVLRAIDRVMPPAPTLFSRIGRVLDPLGFPNVFAQFEPPSASPLPLPSDPAIRAAVARAGPSTVKIVGTACGEILEGSGFVVAPGTVVTNAHVVAGEDGQTVQDRAGSHAAFAVSFDPKLDIAVLRSRGVRAPPLPMTSGRVGRGVQGAVLGYPGGGPLDAEAAVVLREQTAVGRDIYGTGLTARDIYELRTKIRPGNSGGPLVDTHATVVGVVFARSARDANVGYAITSAEAVSRVRQAGSAPVSTGPCAAD
jgi:S1-C subfamily serine protease